MGKKVCFLCIIKATQSVLLLKADCVAKKVGTEKSTRCFSVFTLTKNSADVRTARRKIPFWQYAQNLSNYGG